MNAGELYVEAEQVWPPVGGDATLQHVEHRGLRVRVSETAQNTLVIDRPDPNESTKHCTILNSHTATVLSVAISTDEKRIVSGGWDKSVRVWDCQSYECIHTLLGHTDWVLAVAFSCDGKRIVSGSDDHTLRVWDCESGECLHILSGHSGSVDSAAFSKDGKCIVSGSSDKTIRTWDSKSGECLRTFSEHRSRVRSAAFNNDGKRIVSGGDGKTVQVWDSKSGECLRTFCHHNSRVRSVAFSSDGKRIVSGSDDNTICVWGMKSSLPLNILDSHSDWVRSVEFSGDGKLIVSGSEDGTVRVWDRKSDECVHTLCGHTDLVNSVSCSKEGKRIVSGSRDKTVRVWNTDHSEPSLLALPTIFPSSTFPSVETDVTTVVTYNNGSGCALIWAVVDSSTERKLIGLIHVDNMLTYSNNSDPNYIFETLTKFDAWSSLQYLVIYRPRCGFDIRSIPDWSSLKDLRHFDVSNTPLRALPDDLGKLLRIVHIDVRHCGVPILPSKWSELRNRELSFPGNGLLVDETQLSVLPRALQQKVRQGGNANVFLDYLHDLAKVEIVTQLRMVTVGDAGHGKTFLSGALSNGSNPPPEDSSKVPGSTVGVDMFDFSTKLRAFDPRAGKSSIIKYKVKIWDFAGHDEYFPLHSLLFSELVQYLLVLNAKMINDGRSHVLQLRKWVMSIASRAPRGRVVLMLSQSDRLPYWKENENHREAIALRIAKEGHRQLMEAHILDCSRLEIHSDVVVVDSRKPRFIVVSGPELNNAAEVSRTDVCAYLVRSAIQYMSSQKLFQGGFGNCKSLSEDPVAPLVPALYIRTMEGIAKWRKDNLTWRDLASVSFSWLLRIFVSRERAANSRDVMTFRELCQVLQATGVSNGGEFDRVMTVLQSWGALFYYGTNRGKRYEWRMSYAAESQKEVSHKRELYLADTASKLVFVNPSVLVDVTAHLYLQHHYHKLKRTKDDRRRVASTALPEEAVEVIEQLDTDGLFKKYGIASQTLLERVFEQVKVRHGLSITGVLDLIEAMQLVHKIEVHFPIDPHRNRLTPITVPVYIVPSLISERHPNTPFPQTGLPKRASYDFILQFNSSGLSSLVTHWVLQCKRRLEPKCTGRGIMWNGGADVYGGEKTVARIEWLAEATVQAGVYGVGCSEPTMIRVQGGPLEHVSRDYPGVESELSNLMSTVFTTLRKLVDGCGPCSGIQLVKFIFASPCRRDGHVVRIDAQMVFAKACDCAEGVVINQCEGCEQEGHLFSKYTFRMPFHCTPAPVGDDGDGAVPIVDEENVSPENRVVPYNLEQRAVRFVSDIIIPSLRNHQRNMVQRAHYLEQRNIHGSPGTNGSWSGVQDASYDQGVDVFAIQSELMDMKRRVGQNEKDISEFRDAVEHFRSEFSELINVVNTECDIDVPRLFLILPEDRKWWQRVTDGELNDLFSKPHRLYLLCETRDGPHIPYGHDGYRIRKPHEFIKLYGRMVSRVLRTLSKGLYLASVVPGSEVARKILGSMGDDIREALKNEKSCKAIADSFYRASKYSDKGATIVDGALSGGAPSSCTSENDSGGSGTRVGGSAGRMETRNWRKYLERIDKGNDRAGLQQSPVEWKNTSTQRDGCKHRLWLCPDCFQDAKLNYEATTGNGSEQSNRTLFSQTENRSYGVAQSTTQQNIPQSSTESDSGMCAHVITGIFACFVSYVLTFIYGA